MSSTSGEASTSGSGNTDAAAAIPNAIAQLQIQQKQNPRQGKDKYQFWETQPVAQFHDDEATAVSRAPPHRVCRSIYVCTG
jgi:hypothetical protein